MATFTPRRLAAFRVLWRAVSQGRRPGAPSFGDRVQALPRMFSEAVAGRYPGARARIGLLVLAVAYLLSPVDLVPEALLMLLGLADDAVVGLWLAGAFLSETDRFLAWERTRPLVVEHEPLVPLR